MIRLTFLLAVGLMAITTNGGVADQPRSPALSQTDSESSPAKSPGVELAERHLPELLPVLAYLRDHEPEQHEKAIRDLDRAAKRLEMQSRRGEKFFDAAMRQWQARGRVDLLKARLRVRPNDDDAERLVSELKAYRESELARLTLERETLEQRQRTLTQRAEQATQAAQRAAKQLAEIDKNIERVKSQRSGARPAAQRRTADAKKPDRPTRSDSRSESVTQPAERTETDSKTEERAE